MSFGQYQFRRDTAANWTAANPTLLSGEMAIETDTSKYKIGNGTTAWNALAYGGTAGAAGVGVPTGGTLNQLLAKNSSTDYDDSWKTFDDTIHGTRGGGTAHAVATTSAAGFMSAIDKVQHANWFNKALYNVLDSSVTGNGSTDDLTALNALMSAAPDKSTIFFPPGTYKISGTIAIPAGKHFRFVGSGFEKTTITTTSATLDMITVGDWQNTFDGFTFTSTVTRTGGYAINGGSNVYIFVSNCNFTNVYNGVLLNGTICAVNNCNFGGTVNFSLQFNGGNVNSYVNGCTFDGSPAAVAHIEVNLCGSLLISNCDIIRAVNNLRINPSSSGAFSIYCVNTFFDTAAGSSVKVMGTSDVQRLKFTNCWMSGSVNGIEFAGATGNNSTTAVDIVNCDIYSNSQNGILATNIRDFSVVNSRIANNTTAGINITAGAGSGITKFNIQNNAIGPTGIGAPGSGANGTGVLVAAGTYGGYVITGNNVGGNSTANITDNGTVTNINNKIVDGNLGNLLNAGVQAARSSATAAIANTETQVVGFTAPANSMRVGTVFRIKAGGLFTNTIAASTSTFRVRIGTTSLAGTIPAGVTSVNGTTARTNIPFSLEAEVTIYTAGAAGTSLGYLTLNLANATAPVIAAVTTAAVAVDTTAAKIVELTFISGATTTTATFTSATIDVVQP